MNISINNMLEDLDTIIINTPIQGISCPITHEIFLDPVIASDGITYEKRAIKEWFKKSSVSPTTNLPIDKVLKKNIIIKNIVSDFLEKNLDKKSLQYNISRNHSDNIKKIDEIINNKNFTKLKKYDNFEFCFFSDKEYDSLDEDILLYIYNHSKFKNKKSIYYYHGLILACIRKNYKKMIDIILEKIDDVFVDIDVIQLSISLNHHEILQKILNKSKFDLIDFMNNDKIKNTIIDNIRVFGSVKMFELLMPFFSESRKSYFLLNAVELEKYDVAKYLLDIGATPNTQFKFESGVKYHMIEYVVTELKHIDSKFLLLLIEHGGFHESAIPKLTKYCVPDILYKYILKCKCTHFTGFADELLTYVFQVDTISYEIFKFIVSKINVKILQKYLPLAVEKTEIFYVDELIKIGCVMNDELFNKSLGNKNVNLYLINIVKFYTYDAFIHYSRLNDYSTVTILLSILKNKFHDDELIKRLNSCLFGVIQNFKIDANRLELIDILLNHGAIFNDEIATYIVKSRILCLLHFLTHNIESYNVTCIDDFLELCVIHNRNNLIKIILDKKINRHHINHLLCLCIDNNKPMLQTLIIKEKGIDLHDIKSFFSTIEKGNLELCKMFVTSGTDINSTDVRYCRVAKTCEVKPTPLIVASYYGYKYIVKFLIKNGAKIHIYKNCALNLALLNGHLAVCKILLANGADIREASSSFKSEDWHNILYKRPEISKLLAQYGISTPSCIIL